jgi:hypothetical protein
LFDQVVEMALQVFQLIFRRTVIYLFVQVQKDAVDTE